MDCTSTRLPYRQTGVFSRIVVDYIDQAAELMSFVAHPPTINGIQKSIEIRKQFPTNREVLVRELKKQYAIVDLADSVQKNIEALLSQ